MINFLFPSPMSILSQSIYIINQNYIENKTLVNTVKKVQPEAFRYFCNLSQLSPKIYNFPGACLIVVNGIDVWHMWWLATCESADFQNQSADFQKQLLDFQLL